MLIVFGVHMFGLYANFELLIYSMTLVISTRLPAACTVSLVCKFYVVLNFFGSGIYVLRGVEAV
jgi:hypothetical protein